LTSLVTKEQVFVGTPNSACRLKEKLCDLCTLMTQYKNKKKDTDWELTLQKLKDNSEDKPHQTS
jgi:hypothetical protein